MNCYFYKESKSKKKTTFFLCVGRGGGGWEGARVTRVSEFFFN